MSNLSALSFHVTWQTFFAPSGFAPRVEASSSHTLFHPQLSYSANFGRSASSECELTGRKIGFLGPLLVSGVRRSLKKYYNA